MDDFLRGSVGPSGDVEELQFEQLPFNHPLFIMYSSGTTGAPKCMVHSAGVSSLVFIMYSSGTTGAPKCMVHSAGVSSLVFIMY